MENIIAMVSFLKTHWVAFLSIVSLAVAAVGGIPGIISYLEYRRKKISFGYRFLGVTVGTFGTKTMVLLTGTVTNRGNKPLVPSHYDLKVKIGRRWVGLDRAVIPENAVFSSSEQIIDYTEPSKQDLLVSRSPVTPSTPLRGHLMFIDDTVSPKQMRGKKLNYRLICTDIFGDKYKKDFKGSLHMSDKPVILPKHGVKTQPK